jgi:hypothetical protein
VKSAGIAILQLVGTPRKMREAEHRPAVVADDRGFSKAGERIAQ